MTINIGTSSWRYAFCLLGVISMFFMNSCETPSLNKTNALTKKSTQRTVVGKKGMKKNAGRETLLRRKLTQQEIAARKRKLDLVRKKKNYDKEAKDWLRENTNKKVIVRKKEKAKSKTLAQIDKKVEKENSIMPNKTMEEEQKVRNDEVKARVNEKKEDADDFVSSLRDSSPQEIDFENLPYGNQVENEVGLVYSPYVKEKNKAVNVANMKRGVVVECPFTKKLFRVP